MSVSKKSAALSCVPIEPELREFIDDVLVPMLVRDALRQIAEENRLASTQAVVAQSPRN
jgi:hypothetical protein